MINNPFTTKTMITEPTKFFGRQEQLRHIVNRLQNLQCVSLVGERRIGKSSLLYYLYKTGIEKLGQEYRFVYVDLQDVKNHISIGHLFFNILKELERDFLVTDNIGSNLITFSEIVQEIRQQGIKLVLLFDEFEELIQHREQFPEDFFDQMRALINNGSLGMVTGSQAPLKSLCLDGNLSSPFYNVFSKIELGEFSEEEAADFLSIDRDIEPFSVEEVAFVISYPQYCHPLILQIVCYWVVENRAMRLNDKELEKSIADDAENFFVKGFFNTARRNKGVFLKSGKKLWELAEAILKKKLGG
jgi:predicted AAA+ superfamily ATPase